MGKQAGAPPSGCRELGQRPGGAHLSPTVLPTPLSRLGSVRGRAAVWPRSSWTEMEWGPLQEGGKLGWAVFFLMVFDFFFLLNKHEYIYVCNIYIYVYTFLL